jgi:spore germination cell wall hydrolase CwlJ-like protein
MGYPASAVCFIVLSIASFNVLAADPVGDPGKALQKAETLEQNAASPQPEAPVPKADTITQAEIQAVDPQGKETVDDAITCLSRTIYWEAKGGNAADMEAVAEVVLNRLGHEGFADTVCGVVKQDAQKKKKNCQFSWWCDGRSDQVVEEDRYVDAKEIARKALNQQIKDRTNGALYFHDRRLSPASFNQYVKTAETQKFVFYKPAKAHPR